MKNKVVIEITEEMLLELMGRMGLELGDSESMQAEWFAEVSNAAQHHLHDLLAVSILSALDTLKDRDIKSLETINRRRADAFCEWIKRRIIYTNEYRKDSGAHTDVYVSGMSDNKVTIEIEHGENPLDNIHDTYYVNADLLDDDHVPFEQLWRTMI